MNLFTPFKLTVCWVIEWNESINLLRKCSRKVYPGIPVWCSRDQAHQINSANEAKAKLVFFFRQLYLGVREPGILFLRTETSPVCRRSGCLSATPSACPSTCSLFPVYLSVLGQISSRPVITEMVHVQPFLPMRAVLCT